MNLRGAALALTLTPKGAWAEASLEHAVEWAASAATAALKAITISDKAPAATSVGSGRGLSFSVAELALLCVATLTPLSRPLPQTRLVQQRVKLAPIGALQLVTIHGAQNIEEGLLHLFLIEVGLELSKQNH